jgi:hypothetical protein
LRLRARLRRGGRAWSRSGFELHGLNGSNVLRPIEHLNDVRGKIRHDSSLGVRGESAEGRQQDSQRDCASFHFLKPPDYTVSGTAIPRSDSTTRI